MKKQTKMENTKFGPSKFGDDAIEQVENMKFTSGEKKVLDLVMELDDEFTDEEYFELACYFAERNGLN